MISELGEQRALLDEGHAMQHCVGSFAEQCAAGESLVFSLRDAAGQRLSTAELLLLDGGTQVKVAQHRGVENGEPPQRCEAAVAALLRRLSRPEYAGLRLARAAEQAAQRARRRRELNKEEARLRELHGGSALRLLLPAGIGGLIESDAA